MMSRAAIAQIAVEHLRVVERRDGFLRVDGIHKAFTASGFDPREFLADGARGDETRHFANELRVFSERLLVLAEGA